MAQEKSKMARESNTPSGALNTETVDKRGSPLQPLARNPGRKNSHHVCPWMLWTKGSGDELTIRDIPAR